MDDCDGVKWREVIEIKNGRNQKAVEDINGQYPIYGSGGIMGFANHYLCHENTVIIGRKGSINKPIYVAEKFWNVDTAFGLSTKPDRLFPKYLYYFCISFDFEKLNTTVTIPSLTKSNLLNIEIPLPSIQTQKQIAKTLDAAAELLAMRKQQLVELDNLIKSTFYNMFGDPVTNEKGWEIKQLKDLYFNLDSQRIPITSKNRIKGIYPYYGASGIVDYVKDYIFDGTYLLVSEDGANLLARVTPIAFSIFGKNWVNNHAHILKFKNYPLQLFVENVINKIDIANYVTGSAQPKLNQANLNSISIPYPPFELQSQFTSIVTKIEEQKALVKKAINETQYLFDSLMSEYFE